MGTTQQLLLEGCTDALGFVGGALAGWGLAHMLGLELFAPGYGAGTIAAIALVGLCAGLGLKLARLGRARMRVQTGKN